MRTVLYQKHIDLGAKMTHFADWEMPLYYQGIIKEHESVRNRVGLFDVSHMGRIQIDGPDAASFVDYMSTNHIQGKPVKTATYTVLCNAQGYCIDDTLIYKETENLFFCVANASNRMADFHHLQSHSPHFHVSVTHRFDDEGILALQGPHASRLLSEIFPLTSSLAHMHFDIFPFQSQRITISRTGYTGADGYEIFAPITIIPLLWDLFCKHGKKHGLELCGLGARDTLRQEMGYALYGHEISETIAPIESVTAWAVKMDKETFLGKEALEKLAENPVLRKQYGVTVQDKGIARANDPVFSGENEEEFIGRVTSGTYSPSLKQGIAIIMVLRPLYPGEEVFIDVRGKKMTAKVSKLPFFPSIS